MKKNILIVGHSAKDSAIAKVLSEQFNVFIAPGNDGMKAFSTIVDIREKNVIELLNFVMENDIFFTITTSNEAIKEDIYNLFNDNGQMIFAPTAEANKLITERTLTKKMFYKLRLPAPKFAVYEKKPLAIDYVKNSPMPVVIKTNEMKDKNSVMVCPSVNIAKSYIEDCFFKGEQKIIIEDFVWGDSFTFYVLTDGYKALPLGSVKDYKFSLDGDGGTMTEGIGATSPFLKLTFDHEDYLMNEVVYPVINYLAEEMTPYMGILGFDGVLTPNGDIAITECHQFFNDHDAQGVLALLEDNIFELMQACAIGAFSDEYELLNFKDECSVSAVLTSGQSKFDVITGLDDLQEDTLVAHINTKQNEYLEFETLGERALVLTTTAKTMARACDKLYDEIDAIDFKGKHYRKDLCKIPVNL